MSIDSKKGGKCWSCAHCEDIAVQKDDPNGVYYRKCKNSDHKYIDVCCYDCADYVNDPKYSASDNTQPATAAPAFPPATDSCDHTVKLTSPSVNNDYDGTVRVTPPPANNHCDGTVRVTPPPANNHYDGTVRVTPPPVNNYNGTVRVNPSVPVPPQPPVQPVRNTPIATKKKSGKGLTIVIIVLIVALIGALGFLAYNMWFSDNSSSGGKNNAVSSKDYLNIPAIVITEGDSVETKKKPSESSGTAIFVPSAADVTILSEDENWVYIDYIGTKGWCPAKYVIKKTDYINEARMAVSTDSYSVTMYNDADSSSGVATQISNCDSVLLIKEIGDWSYVLYTDDYGNVLGWCQTSVLFELGENRMEDAIVKIADTTLPLRQSPSTSSATIYEVNVARVVTVHNTLDDWSLVEYSGHIGWCPTDSLVMEKDLGSHSLHAIVTTEQYNLNIRQEPSLSGKILYSIPKGEIVPVFEEANGWYYIQYQGVTGWCSGDKLTLVAH